MQTTARDQLFSLLADSDFGPRADTILTGTIENVLRSPSLGAGDLDSVRQHFGPSSSMNSQHKITAAKTIARCLSSALHDRDNVSDAQLRTLAGFQALAQEVLPEQSISATRSASSDEPLDLLDLRFMLACASIGGDSVVGRASQQQRDAIANSILQALQSDTDRQFALGGLATMYSHDRTLFDAVVAKLDDSTDAELVEQVMRKLPKGWRSTPLLDRIAARPDASTLSLTLLETADLGEAGRTRILATIAATDRIDGQRLGAVLQREMDTELLDSLDEQLRYRLLPALATTPGGQSTLRRCIESSPNEAWYRECLFDHITRGPTVCKLDDALLDALFSDSMLDKRLDQECRLAMKATHLSARHWLYNDALALTVTADTAETAGSVTGFVQLASAARKALTTTTRARLCLKAAYVLRLEESFPGTFAGADAFSPRRFDEQESVWLRQVTDALLSESTAPIEQRVQSLFGAEQELDVLDYAILSACLENAAERKDNALDKKAAVGSIATTQPQAVLILKALVARIGDLTEPTTAQWRSRLISTMNERSDSAKVELRLRLLNVLMPDDTETSLGLQPQRLTILAKDLAAIFQSASSSEALTFHMAPIWRKLLPRLSRQTGSFWETLVTWLASSLGGARGSTSVQFALYRLLAALDSHSGHNDDLSESWAAHHAKIRETGAKLFLSEVASSDAADDLATRKRNDVAIRALADLPSKLIAQSSQADLFQALLVAERSVQNFAFGLLQSVLKAQREDMIMTSALAKEFEELDVEIVPELISILLDPPIADDDVVTADEGTLNGAMRGYMLAWLLAMTYFEGCPMRMRLKLAADLQSHDKLVEALGVVLSNIESSRKGNRYDGIQGDDMLAYDPHDDRANETLRLSVRLYYLFLLHLPSSVRAWWTSSSDRALTSTVESLTERHFSGRIIKSVIEILNRSETQKSLAAEDVSVRMLDGGREVITSYELDDQTMEMAVKLPGNYPLRNVAVEGLKRVGVKDAQWRAWMLGSQAVLTAQNGSILDAIRLFQRNVKLHFQHVQECAICFAILSPENQTPSKKCATCKNLFHGSCLFKWFKSSSQSKCPLCRTSFAFER